MSHRLIVRIQNSAEDPLGLTHKLRNFAEDLDRHLNKFSFGRVPNMDTATNEVEIEIRSKRHQGDVLAITRALLQRHHLAADSSIERVKR